MPPLRDLDGRDEEVVGVLRVGRFHHGQPGGDRVSAVVLLVLRRGHARVVGGDYDQGAAHTRVGRREQRVRGHVEADVLHGHERASVRESRPEPNLQGNLLVGRPLRPAAELVE